MGDQTTPEVTKEPAAPAETQPPDKSGQGAADNKPDGKQTFTQDDLNRIVGERATRAKETAVSDLLKSLGIDSADTLKKLVTDHQAAEDASKSELQKAQDAAARAKAEKDALAQQLEAERQQRLIDKRDAKIVELAGKAKAEHPTDVIKWAETDAPDLLKAAIAADGGIDEAAVNKLIEACRKERKSWFVGTGPGSPSNAGGKTPEPDAKAKQAAQAEAFKRTRRSV